MCVGGKYCVCVGGKVLCVSGGGCTKESMSGRGCARECVGVKEREGVQVRVCEWG